MARQAAEQLGARRQLARAGRRRALPAASGVAMACTASGVLARLPVSSGGTATCSLPLALPPGIASVVPSLALVHDGRNVNGPVGHGWSLQGTVQEIAPPCTSCRGSMNRAAAESGASHPNGGKMAERRGGRRSRRATRTLLMELLANTAQLENDGYGTILSFADNPADPRDFIILQMVNAPSPQDVKLHLDGIHLEVSGHSFDGYGLVTDIQPTSDGVLILLDDTAAAKAGLDSRLLVKMKTPTIARQTVKQAAEVFQERLGTRSR